ncbi:hypothetical protein Tco_0592544 [Tanacetum coccineum]
MEWVILHQLSWFYLGSVSQPDTLHESRYRDKDHLYILCDISEREDEVMVGVASYVLRTSGRKRFSGIITRELHRVATRPSSWKRYHEEEISCVETRCLTCECRGLPYDDEGYGLDDKSRGIDDDGHTVESDRLGLEEDEEAVPGGQQQAAPVIGMTMSSPLGLGYRALRCRELALEEGDVYNTFEVRQGSGLALKSKILERVSAFRQPTLTQHDRRPEDIYQNYYTLITW